MNDSSSPSPQCPRCGAVLPAHAPEGLCPRCLAALPLGPETAFTAEPKIPVTPPLSPAELAPHFPQLEILECLGRGGMGVVYKARQKSLNRLVALKLLAPERARDGEFAIRFTREAHALAALNHPHIVTIHDFGRAGGFYFLLMEFVDGVNLRQAMTTNRFTPDQALTVVPPICEALQYAHEHGIVHRDIKPENLLLDKEGRVKIADFGIAKMLGEDTNTGVVESQPAGTPQYMAPEQKEHQRTDHRADIYSLGVVLYEMLTGELPADQLQPPSRRVTIDVRLDEIVLRALEKTPELRYQTAAEFRTQLETVTQSTAGEQAAAAEAVPLPTVRAWLALLDRGEYAASWDAGAAWFHRAITKEKWTAEAEKVRSPLGDILSRAVLDTEFSGSGSRFQVRFQAAFEELPAATETVLFARERDGAWRATGYLIRPAGYGEEDARFSRLAIAGAAWATLFFAFVPAFLWHEVKTHEFETHGPFASALVVFIFFIFIFPAFIAPFAATILGWISVTQIRRSAGRLYGLWLGVLDGLAFPLLVLDGLIGGFCFLILKLVLRALPPSHYQLQDPRGFDDLMIASGGIAVLAIAAFVDWLIIRAVWRAVNRPVYLPSPPPAPSSPVAAVNTPLSTAAYCAAWASGICAAITWSWFPHAPVYWPWAILLFALAALALAIPVRHTPRGRWALWFGAIQSVVWVLIWALFAFVLPDSRRFTREPSGFGPATECVFTDAIDLETGVMTPLPVPPPSDPKIETLYELEKDRQDEWFHQPPSDHSAFPWLRQRDVDLVEMGDHRLVAIDMVLFQLKDGDFDVATSAFLEGKFHELQSGRVPWSAPNGKPATWFPSQQGTYLFCTRAGRLGVLQSTIDEHLPRGVKLRYKFLATASKSGR